MLSGWPGGGAWYTFSLMATWDSPSHYAERWKPETISWNLGKKTPVDSHVRSRLGIFSGARLSFISFYYSFVIRWWCQRQVRIPTVKIEIIREWTKRRPYIRCTGWKLGNGLAPSVPSAYDLDGYKLGSTKAPLQPKRFSLLASQ